MVQLWCSFISKQQNDAILSISAIENIIRKFLLQFGRQYIEYNYTAQLFF